MAKLLGLLRSGFHHRPFPHPLLHIDHTCFCWFCLLQHVERSSRQCWTRLDGAEGVLHRFHTHAGLLPPLFDNQTQSFWESKLKSDDHLRSSISCSQLETNSTWKSSFLTFWKSWPLFASPCPIHAVCVPILHIFQFNWNVASKEKE